MNDSHKSIRHSLGAQPPLKTYKVDSVSVGNKHIRQSPHRQGGLAGKASVVAFTEKVVQRHVEIVAQKQHRRQGRLLLVRFPAMHGVAVDVKHLGKLPLRHAFGNPHFFKSFSESFHTYNLHENRDYDLTITVFVIIIIVIITIYVI